MRTLFHTIVVLTAVIATPAAAALSTGAKAPQFTAEGALGGKAFTFSLAKQLKKGPVVLYFFPAAFTQGCTLEAHEFAEATERFSKLGATVVGVTAGNVDRVAQFSTSECRNKFAVLADPGAKIAAQYHTVLKDGDTTLSNRTSYVIASNGRITMSYEDLDPDLHVSKALSAVKSINSNAAR